MFIPLSALDAGSVPGGSPLGEYLGRFLSKTEFRSLLQCLCEGAHPAIHSSKPGRPPLLHDALRAFVSNFVLPHAADRPPWKQNDRVMVLLHPGPENALALLALANYHTCAPVNASCTATELKGDVLRLQAKAIITSEDVGKRLELESLQAELNCQIFYIRGRDSGPAGLFDLFVPEGTNAVIPSRPTEPHGLDDISLILHTSGTSGKKKVVRYSLRTLLVGTWCVVHSWDLKANDVNLNMMPLFHVGGVMRNLLAPILSGGSSIMCDGFDTNVFWSLAVELQPTWYYAAPTIHHALLSTKPNSVIPSRDLHIRLICNAAGGLLPSLATALKETFGAVVLPSYGMTECMPIATPLTNYQLDRIGCSGIPCGPSVSIRETHDLEQELPTGSIGAICTRGLPTFDGYELSPAVEVPLDRSAFSSEGWFNSGDVGYLDEDGYLYITGRSKEIINKGGEVVSPFEVEEAIVTVTKGHFKSALAFSIEHDVLQEVIGVVVVPEQNRSRLSLQQLHDLLKGHLHPSKWPFAVVYMDDIPKNSAGKPLRINLSKRFGIGKLSDDTPPLHRHFEAAFPENQQLLSEPIPCTRVAIGAYAVENVLRNVPGVDNVTLRRRRDESLDAYISVTPHSKLVVRDIEAQLMAVLIPGYAIPNHMYIIQGPLARDGSGNYNYEGMEVESLDNGAIDIDKMQRLVRDIFADILDANPTHMRKDSDFFLLGGNSLLLGKLSHYIRKQSGINIGIAELFSNSTIQGIASLIEENDESEDHCTDQDTRKRATTANPSLTGESMDYDFEYDPEYARKMRGQTQDHPLCLVVQAIPFFLFSPLKSALGWSFMLATLSQLSGFIAPNFWHRMVDLFSAIFVARVCVGIICPVTAIAFKWIIIGRYQPGTHRMWSMYYLRWWIVNQGLMISDLGIFSLHPSLTKLYYRLLGAKIGKNVYIDESTRLYECDLITLQDGCHLDTSTLRGFCVERDGHFRLEPITIGRKAFINIYTSISPGFRVPDGSVYGPHASSHDSPSPKSFAAYNRTLLPEPRFFLKLFVAWPIIALVILSSYIPWMLALYAMVAVDPKHLKRKNLNNLETLIRWFASPERVKFHTLSRVVKALFQPLIQLALGILVKRAFGLNNENPTSSTSQMVLLRRYINSILLSNKELQEAFAILGTHYEIVSIVYRAMGAKIGQRVYWPGSGIYCTDPELLEIGDDVIFGSRSFLITTDRQGTGKIVIENGAMIADRVVVLPGTRVGASAVLGSGALGKRNGTYEAGSTWIGNDKGEAICLDKGSKKPTTEGDTITPFGKAFYKKEAPYFVFPYIMILVISVAMTAFSAMYWSISAVGSAQILRNLQIHLPHFKLFAPRWYRFGILYALISMCFMLSMTTQGILSVLWVITMKWALVGRRTTGPYDWDQSNYCQLWQLHLTLSRLVLRGYGYGGVLGPFAGSAYIVWYFRALGATIGENCGLWVGGKAGLMTEPDLVEIGDDVNLDDCSVVAHLNSRGRFSLNRLKIGNQCAMRSDSRLLSGASMEDNSMLCEHTLLTSGDVADSGVTYAGWPAKRLEDTIKKKKKGDKDPLQPAFLTCPICRQFPRDSTMSDCGHVFCEACLIDSLSTRKYCPVCFEPASLHQLRKVHLSFAVNTPRA